MGEVKIMPLWHTQNKITLLTKYLLMFNLIQGGDETAGPES